MLQSSSFNQEEQQTQQLLVDNQEEFAQVLDALLPQVPFLTIQIEKQLMKDIELELQTEFQQKYQQAIHQINSQALQQFQHAVQELQQSRTLLQTQKQSEIQTQIDSLQSNLSRLQEQIILKLQEQFLEQHFDDRIMTHHKIQALQKQIQQEIYQVLEEKHQTTKQRQIKELIIAHQTKEIKLRKQLDQQIKSRIYSSSGLQELKQEIKLSKTQMGSQKSEYNLKLKRIQSEIKEYQDKIREYQRMPQLQELREKYEELRVDLIERETERQLVNDKNLRRKTDMDEYEQEDKENQHRELDDSLDQNQEDERHFRNNFTHQHKNDSNDLNSNSKTLKRQNRNQLLNQDAKYGQNNQDQPLHEEDLESQGEPQRVRQENTNSRKFNFTAYFKGNLLNSQTAQITQSQNIYIQENPAQKKSLLNLENVSDLLKQKITMDPLERYLNKQSVSKENDMNSQNIHQNCQKTSNFAELYEQHLKNLNKGFAKNTIKTTQSSGQGLSQMAKKTLIKNLSSYHRNNFSSSSNDENFQRSTAYPANFVHEPFKTYESNLLGSYK